MNDPRSLENAYQAMRDVCLSQEQALTHLDLEHWLLLMGKRENCFAHIDSLAQTWQQADPAAKLRIRGLVREILDIDARMQAPLRQCMAQLETELNGLQRGGTALLAYQGEAPQASLFMDQSG